MEPKEQVIPEKVSYLIGGVLLRQLGSENASPTDPTDPSSEQPQLQNIEPDQKPKKLDKKKLIKFRFNIIAAPAVLLLTLVSLVGYSYSHYSTENKDLTIRVSEIKQDTFSSETASQYLTNAPDGSLKTKIEKIDQQPVIITIGSVTVTPKPADIDKWLNLITNDTKGTTDITVIPANVLAYVNSLATQNDQAVVNKVVVTHSNGTSAVLFQGSNGIQVSGMQAASDQISASVLSGNGINANLSVVTTPYLTTSTIPPQKIIEVDLTNKIMYLYQGGSLVQTYLVTAGAPLTPTPVGTFHIYEKLLSQNMSGFNYNGTPYFQPNVPYVNYFDGADAVHGNYWRPASYFGNINSSHGCVGLQVANAAWVYNWAPIGTTVITHY